MEPAATATEDKTASQPFDPSENDLNTDMSDDELLAFVDKTLGAQPTVKNSFGNSTALPTPNDIAQGKEEANEKNKEPSITEENKQEPKKEATPPKEETVTTEREPNEPEQPVEIPAVDTSDLWIEIQGIALDAEGNQKDQTYRITLEDGIPDDIRFRDDKQLAEVLDSINEMRAIRDQRQAEYDEAMAEREEQERTTQSITDNETRMIQQWDQEIEDLTQAGLLERPKEVKTSYTPEEVENDPALKRIDNIYSFMAEENGRRQKEGKSPLGSFAAAFNLFQRQENQIQADKEAQEREAEIKRKGSMVGGGSGGSSGNSGKGYVYKAGSAKSIYSIDTSDI